MPTARQDQDRRSTSLRPLAGNRLTPERSGGCTPGARHLARRLAGLLSATPVDLRCLGEQNRSAPGLEALVMKLSISWARAAGNRAATVEEAAIVLGTDRLRVLVDLWSRHMATAEPVQVAAGDHTDSRRPPGYQPRRGAAASLLPEVPQVACGRDAGQRWEWSEILLRDLMSLIPLVDPALCKPRGAAHGTDAVVSRAKDLK